MTTIEEDQDQKPITALGLECSTMNICSAQYTDGCNKVMISSSSTHNEKKNTRLSSSSASSTAEIGQQQQQSGFVYTRALDADDDSSNQHSDEIVMRNVLEIIPRFDQIHMHLKKHLVRNDVAVKQVSDRGYSKRRHRKPPWPPNCNQQQVVFTPLRNEKIEFDVSVSSRSSCPLNQNYRQSSWSPKKYSLAHDTDGDLLDNSLIEDDDKDDDDSSTLSMCSVSSSSNDMLSDVEMNPLDSSTLSHRRRLAMNKIRKCSRCYRSKTSTLVVDVDSEDVLNPGNLRLMRIRDDVVFLNNYVYIHDDSNKVNDSNESATMKALEKEIIKDRLDEHDHRSLSQGFQVLQEDSGCCAHGAIPRCDEMDRTKQLNGNPCNLFRTIYGSSKPFDSFSPSDNEFKKEAVKRRRKCLSIDNSKLNNGDQKYRSNWMHQVLTWIRGKTQEDIQEQYFRDKDPTQSYTTGFNAPNLRLSNMLKEASLLTSLQPEESIEKGDTGFPVEVTMASRENSLSMDLDFDALKISGSEKDEENESKPHHLSSDRKQSDAVTFTTTEAISERYNLTSNDMNSMHRISETENSETSSPVPPIVAIEDQSSDEISHMPQIASDILDSVDPYIIEPDFFSILSKKDKGEIISTFNKVTEDISNEQFLRKYGCRREDFLFLSENEKVRIIHKGEDGSFETPIGIV